MSFAVNLLANGSPWDSRAAFVRMYRRSGSKEKEADRCLRLLLGFRVWGLRTYSGLGVWFRRSGVVGDFDEDNHEHDYDYYCTTTAATA